MTLWILLGVAGITVALGLLTVFRAPDWLDWRITVLVSQYGYLISIVPAATGLAVLFLPGGRGAPALFGCGLSVLGFVLLAQPCAQAWALARGLPQRLESQFGPGGGGGPAFSLARLFRGAPEAVPRSTWTFSGAQQLDFYPAIGRSPAPCVILVHGGGWDSGDRGELSHFNDWLARGGYAVASVSYRLAPGAIWPAQKEDVIAAIAYVKAHASSLGVDPTRLVLIGRSAGGQIAEACAYAIHDPAVRGVVGLYAPADMHFAWAWGREDDALRSPELLRKFLGGTPLTAGAAYDSASSIRFVDAGSPPTLLVHGDIDTLVWNQQSQRLAARLSGSGVPNLLLSIPWGSHGLEYNLGSPSGQLTTYAVRWFLAATCR